MACRNEVYGGLARAQNICVHLGPNPESLCLVLVQSIAPGPAHAYMAGALLSKASRSPGAVGRLPRGLRALTCARVCQVLPAGQLRASRRAVPLCRQHRPVHEHHRAAQQHLRVPAQPPGRSVLGGREPSGLGFAAGSPFSSLSPFPKAQLFSHEVRLAGDW